MKICLIGYKLSVNRPEAVNNIVYGLSLALKKKKNEVVIITNANKECIKYVNGIKVYGFPVKPSLNSFIPDLFNFGKKIRKVFINEKFDVVHDFFVIPGVSLLIILWIKFIKLAHNPLFIKSSLNKTLKFKDIVKLSKPFNYKYFLNEVIFRLVLGNSLLTRFSYGRFDLVVCHNKYEKKELQLNMLGKKIIYLPIGVDIKRNKNNEMNLFSSRKPGEKRILFFGHPSVKKGVYEFINTIPEVLKINSNIVFYFYFSDVAESKKDLTTALHSLKKMFPNNVYYKSGFFSPWDLFKYFDLFVLPLRHDWSSISPPLSILEARIVGIPVLTSKLTLTKEISKHDRFTFLLNNLNVSYMSRKILEVINKLDGHKHKLLVNYEWDNLSKQYINLYENFSGSFYENKNIVENYDKYRFGTPGGSYVNKKELTSLIYFGPNIDLKKAADLGAGTGRVTNHLIDLGVDKVIALDNSQEMINILKKNVKQKNISFVKANITNLPIKDNSVDIITSLRVFEHLSQQERNKMLMECYRIINKNGRLYLSTLNKLSIENAILSFRKSQSLVYADDVDISEMFKKFGFKIKNINRDFVIPRFVFRDSPKFLLGLLFNIEDLLEKSIFNKYAAHISWELKVNK